MITQSFLSELKFEAENSRKLFNAIPDDVLEYKANDFNWTIAELASHTAEVYNWWPVTLHQNVLDLSQYKYDKGDISSMRFITQKLEENIAVAISSLDGYPDDKYMEMWSMKMG